MVFSRQQTPLFREMMKKLRAGGWFQPMDKPL
jgi:hypothetical protein